MSGRYPPHDARYDSRDRDRSRSPPRFSDRRPGYGGPPFNNARAAAPVGRGRSYPEGDIRPQSFAPARDRPSRDFDRRPPPRPPSPGRPRSPPRARDELDPLRPRRNSRDGPLSADAFDHSSFSSSLPSRGGYGAPRGRGRGNPEFDRYRRPDLDDRHSHFRPRSPPPRWGRSNSRDGRDDWRPGMRNDADDRWTARDRERERDPRERDQPWRGPPSGQRYDSRSSADGSGPPTPVIPSQPQTPAAERPPHLDARTSLDRRASATVANRGLDGPAASDTSSLRARVASPLNTPLAPSVPAFSFAFNKPTATVSGTSVAVHKSEAEEQPLPEAKPKEKTAEARVETTEDVKRETAPIQLDAPGRDVAKVKEEPVAPALENDTAGRAQQTTRQDDNGKFMAEGAAPVVPEAGTQSAANDAPNKAAASVPPPLSPKQSRPPPEAPRGPRALEASSPVIPTEPRHSRATSLGSTASSIPTGPAALRHDDRSQYPNFSFRNRASVSGPSSAASTSPSLAPWQLGSQTVSNSAQPSDITERKPPTGPAADNRSLRGGSATPAIPTGPRAASVKSPSVTIASLPSPRIPTAPRADRVPPTGPRADSDRASFSSSRSHDRSSMTMPRAPPTAPRGGSWGQWRSPGILTGPGQQRMSSGDGRDQAMQSINAGPSGQAVKQESADVKSASINEPEQTDTGRLDDTGDPVESAIDSSSDDDDMMDEDDLEAPERRFEATQARLLSQMADLRDPRYRMTSPFEQIARIARITADDIPPPGEESPEPEAPELDDEEASGPTEVDQELMTPDDDGTEEDVVMDDDDVADARLARLPPRKRTPEPINLPHLLKTPLSPTTGLREHVEAQMHNRAALVEHFEKLRVKMEDMARETAHDYADNWKVYKTANKQMEAERSERERIEREQSNEANAELESAANPPETPVAESRRLHKFSSEYDIQKILKESEEMARQQREKEEKDAQKARDAVEKEAVIPPLMDEDLMARSIFVNTNTRRRPEQLVMSYGFEPPPDDFTEEEHDIFLHAYKERPKKWGEIAALLPDRTYTDCIHHYYTHKWDGRFRETKRRRGRGGGRARGGRAPARVRGAALMADLGSLDDDANGPVEQTASGRPRRAATRGNATPALTEAESESKNGTATPAKRGAKTEPAGAEPAEKEKPGRKRRAPAAEKVSKRIKSQSVAASNAASAASTATIVGAPAVPAPPVPSLAPGPVASPVKAERDLQFRTSELSKEEMARMDDASLLAGLHAGHRAVRDTGTVFHAESYYQHTPEVVERNRSSSTVQSSSRQSASSYWSVPEQQDFLKFLAYYGTDFAAIAAQMGTKTHTMVKNHYQRRLEGESRDDYQRAAEEANERRRRGEDMGPAPTPTPIVKRRYDQPPTLIGRTSSGHGEPGDVEDIVMTDRYAPVGMPAAGQGRVAQPLPSSLTSGPSAPAQPARASQAAGPRMGFFSDSRPAAAQPPSRPATQPLQTQGPPRSHPSETKGGIPQSAWYQDLVQEQQRAIGLQKEHDARSSDRVHQVHHHGGYPPHMETHDAPLKHEDRGQMQMPPMYPRSGSATMRQRIGSPSMPSTMPTPFAPPHHAGPIPSPPKQSGFRPSSVPAGSPAAPPSQAAPPPEPRKSNIMSILNSEPTEDRAIKRLSDHGVQRAHSPASVHRVPTPTGSIHGHQRRDTIGSNGGIPRSYYDRPGASTPTQPPAQPKYEPYGGAPRREYDWAPRSNPPPPSGSPAPGALERDRGYYQQPRGPPTPLAGPARSAASPPPAQYNQSVLGRTSRGSSFSASGPPPTSQLPPSQYPPPPREQAPLHRPYGAPPHLQQQAPPQHHSPSQPPVEYTSRRTSREEELARDRWAYEERERERVAYEREREREAYAAAEARYRAPPAAPAPSAPAYMREQQYDRPPPPPAAQPEGRYAEYRDRSAYQYPPPAREREEEFHAREAALQRQRMEDDLHRRREEDWAREQAYRQQGRYAYPPPARR